MELPDRIEDMTKEQLQHLDMLVDQLDELYPTDRTEEERLAKDPHLAILPSGSKRSTKRVRSFDITTVGSQSITVGQVIYEDGDSVELTDPHDIAAFNAALNDIGVYVAAPTLKGDDNDGVGQTAEGAPV